jgi:hypothetical protein
MSSEEKKTTGEIYAETGKAIAEMLKTPACRAAWLRMGHDIEMMRIDQPKAPRSRKRETDEHRAIRAGIWVGKFPFMQNEVIDPIIKNALESGTAPEVFAAISKGASLAKTKLQLSGFARLVITALTVALHIMENENMIPTKELVRKEAENVFRVKKWEGFQDDDQRWTEFFAAAGLGDLPIERKPRGPGKHGDEYTEGRKNPKATPSIWGDEIEVILKKKR